MKTHPRILIVATYFFCLFATSRAGVIIDSTTRNGSFESGNLGNPDNWMTGLKVEVVLREMFAPFGTGDWSLSIGSSSDGSKRGALQKTDHIVASGETFDFSFAWANASSWDSTPVPDTVDWRLFTTSDNTVGGAVTDIASGSTSADSDTGNLTYEEVSYTGIGTVTGASVGQDLWVEIYSASTEDSEFGRLDRVELSAIPEPGTLVLVGVALGSLLYFRRWAS